MNGRDLLSLSFRVIGLFFAGVAAIVAISTAFFVSRAYATQGTVVDHTVEQNAITFLRADEPTGLLHYPVVEYRSASGDVHQITGRMGRTRPRFEEGEQVTVLVAPADSSHGRLNTVFGIWGSAIILGGLGVLFLLLSVLAPFGFGGSRRS